MTMELQPYPSSRLEIKARMQLDTKYRNL
jgi:hypothetical protein